MPAGTDRVDPFEAEIPLFVRVEEGLYKASRSGIHMNGNVVARLFIELVKMLVELFDVVIKARPCDTHDGDYTNGILVAKLDGLFGIEGGLFGCERHGAHLYLPQLREFLPHNLIG